MKDTTPTKTELYAALKECLEAATLMANLRLSEFPIAKDIPDDEAQAYYAAKYGYFNGAVYYEIWCCWKRISIAAEIMENNETRSAKRRPLAAPF